MATRVGGQSYGICATTDAKVIQPFGMDLVIERHIKDDPVLAAEENELVANKAEITVIVGDRDRFLRVVINGSYVPVDDKHGEIYMSNKQYPIPATNTITGKK